MITNQRPVMKEQERKAFLAKEPWKSSTFHNPYTFIPFPLNEPKRVEPTEMTIDEVETDRVSGILELEVTTKTPLLSCDAQPRDRHGKPIDRKAQSEEAYGHAWYKALTIGNDVIVPATGIRGAMRTLMTILVGGNLGYIDEDLFLCQGRDASLGPRKYDNERKPVNVFLGIVENHPSREFGLKVRLGRTALVELDQLRRVRGYDDSYRPTSRVDRKIELWIDNPDKPESLSRKKDQRHPWRLKLSGQRVNSKGLQREGAIKPGDQVVDLDKDLYRNYLGRHRNAVASELKRGDVVWLEPTHLDAVEIKSGGDVKSIQWARWGRSGDELLKRIEDKFHPDYLRADGKVDEVTNLFGMASPDKEVEVQPFAARIRPENLVFRDAAGRVQTVTLAPLAPPKPGCKAFYREAPNPEDLDGNRLVGGYKVYRVPADGDEPWRYEAQPVYDDQGRPKPPYQAVNRTVELVPKQQKGTLKIAFRALNRRELALLIQTCSVPWRLGGGKPLGLGACEVKISRMLGETGEEVPLPDDWQSQVNDEDIRTGVYCWTQSQVPVPRMRYPSAVSRNRNKINRGGHVWFQRHAAPRKGTRSGQTEPVGLESKQLASKLGGKDLPGFPLPEFDPRNPIDDVLYGLHILAETESGGPQRNQITEFKLFDPDHHTSGEERSGGNQSQSAVTRTKQRSEDRAHPGGNKAAQQAAPQAEPAPEAPKVDELRKGLMVDAVICADPKNKGRVFARHEPTGVAGMVLNGASMPEAEKAEGKAVRLQVFIYNQITKIPQFKWPEAD